MAANGGLVLRYALEEEDVGSVTAIGRRPTGLEHAKLRDPEHADFTDFGTISERLRGQDVAFFCLGAWIHMESATTELVRPGKRLRQADEPLSFFFDQELREIREEIPAKDGEL